MPSKIVGIAAAGFFVMAMPLLSQDMVFKNSRTMGSLVELYSSEGCSSCPPAEAWLNDLKQMPGLWKDLFPVAFHVDYWDGLGWPDRFAKAEYTRRQRDYAARLGQDSVYTPEFVVNGAEWRRDWTGAGFPRPGMQKSGELAVTVTKEKKVSAVYLPGLAEGPPALTLNVALLGFDVVTDVKRGENGGRTLKHDFVVLGFCSTALTMNSNGWKGGPVEMKSSTGDAPRALVAWVSTNDGAILQIAGGWLRAE